MLYQGKNSTLTLKPNFVNNSPGSEDGKPKHDVADWLVLLLVGRPVDNQLSSVFHCATTASVSDHYQTIPSPP